MSDQVKRLYIVSEGGWDWWEVVGVFSSRKRAEDAMASAVKKRRYRKRDLGIDVYLLDIAVKDYPKEGI